jgi:hypothetical protein
VGEAGRNRVEIVWCSIKTGMAEVLPHSIIVRPFHKNMTVEANIFFHEKVLALKIPKASSHN